MSKIKLPGKTGLRAAVGRTSKLITALAILALASAWVPAAYAQLSVLYNFGAKVGDPVNPSLYGFIAQGRDGNLYTTSQFGGAGSCGTVFRVTGASAERTLYSFTGGTDGCYPYGGVTLGTDGNFYGTTAGGGDFAAPPTLFKISSAGVIKILHTFSLASDTLRSAPVLGRSGDLYGTVYSSHSDFGSFYKITSTGQFTTLYHFDSTHGSGPGPIILGADGNFYGTTAGGGNNSTGVAFKLTPSGKIKVLHNFTVAVGYPSGGLVQGSDGNFYGIEAGNGNGAIFRMTATGEITVLHKFKPNTDGAPPYGLVQASDGNLYGGTGAGGNSTNCNGTGCGTIFQMTPAGILSVPVNFDGTDGEDAQVPPFQNTNGILYGDTEVGGKGGPACGDAFDCGVFYALDEKLPAFTAPLPNGGKVNQTIGFLGQGFTAATAVAFNGTGASFNVVSATYLTAKVPNGAITGLVSVTTPGGTLTSYNNFNVTPQITTFNPPNGPAGTQVTITGVSLTQTNDVAFDGVKSTQWTVNSDTQVTATVPNGAATGKIVITTVGGTTQSATPFTVN